MKKIKNFNRTNLEQLDSDILKALQPVFDKHGVMLTSMPGRFNSTEYNLKLNIIVTDPSIKPGESGREIELRKSVEKYGRLFNVSASDIGKVFDQGGARFTFVGINMKAKKYPIVGKNKDNGKLYKFDETVLSKIRVVKKKKS